MARIVLNPAIQIISGDVGGFVYRQQDDGSVILAKQALPDPTRQPTEAQAEQMQRFKDASARYRRMMEDAGTQAAYQQIRSERGLKSPLRALVIGDILKAPKISTIDLSNYMGAIGDTIRVIAEDTVGVSRLKLIIHDQSENADIETSEKVINSQISGSVEWVYTATQAVATEDAIEVRVTAYDLAGNKIEMSQAK